MNKLCFAFILTSPLVVSIASARPTITDGFKNQPVWKCNGGEGASFTHIDMQATTTDVMEGGMDRTVNGQVVSTPIEAKYGRLGTRVYVYKMEWEALPKEGPGLLQRTRPVPKPILKLKPLGDNLWEGTLADTGVVVKCEDFTKDDEKK